MAVEHSRKHVDTARASVAVAPRAAAAPRPADDQAELVQLRSTNKGLQQKVADLQSIAAKTMDLQRQMRRGSSVAEEQVNWEQQQSVRTSRAGQERHHSPGRSPLTTGAGAAPSCGRAGGACRK